MIRKPNFKLNWKYALGELVLIFLGISLAIAFQNWNEDRKEKAFEREILIELQESLAIDIAELELIEYHFKKADESIIKSFQFADTGIDKDSLSYWFADFINFDRFNPSISAYEVLKSKGLQIIRNKKLRLLVAEYYDNRIPKVIQSLSDVELAFKRDIVNLLRREFSDIEYRNFVLFNNVDEFFENKDNVVLIKLFRDNRRGAFDDLEDAISVNKRITSIISDQ